MESKRSDVRDIQKPLGKAADATQTWPFSGYTRLHNPLLKSPPDAALDTLDAVGAVWLSHAMGTWQWDLDTDKCLWNKRTFDLLGLDPATSEASGSVFFSLTHPEDHGCVKEAVSNATAATGRFDEEFRIVHPNGEERWLLARGVVVPDEKGEPSEMVGVILDITDRKRDETEMHEVNLALEHHLTTLTEAVRNRSVRLKEMTVQIIQAEQAERKRIASLLHDNVQQTLVAAILGAEKAKRQTNSASARETLTKVVNAVQEVIARTRLLSIQLDPPILTHGTLSQALSWLADSKQEQHGLRVLYEEVEGLDAPSEAVKHFLFEAARELLFNVVKHAGVKQTAMKLEMHEGALCLAIDDQGKGCESGLLQNVSRDRGIGLAMIEERAAILGGKVRFNSVPGAGFHALIRIPVEGPAASR
ncbi:MAG: PAS domain-containing protein, partial [Candidatus Hydrogenedentes bacterium]|nr:PAS domain-containing protein [Candidatus Hydrogenedentota bacterium]